MRSGGAVGPRRVIGYLCLSAGTGSALLLVSSAFLVLWASRNDTSSFPLVAVGLGAFSMLMWTLGWRLMEGLPLWVPSFRWPAGIFILVLAALAWIASLHDSDVPRWSAVSLCAGGIAVLLSWKPQGSTAGPP